MLKLFFVEFLENNVLQYLLLQASLDQSSVPQDWKVANVVPILKSGSSK